MTFQSIFVKLIVDTGNYYCLIPSDIEKLKWMSAQEKPPEWMTFMPAAGDLEVHVRTDTIIGFYLTSAEVREAEREWEAELRKEVSEPEWK